MKEDKGTQPPPVVARSPTTATTSVPGGSNRTKKRKLEREDERKLMKKTLKDCNINSNSSHTDTSRRRTGDVGQLGLGDETLERKRATFSLLLYCLRSIPNTCTYPSLFLHQKILQYSLISSQVVDQLMEFRCLDR